MTMPLALVERWPDQKYLDQHGTKEAALKANVRDAHALNQEIHWLHSQIRPGDSKRIKAHNKAIMTKIRTREKWLDDLIKYSDYAAMLMANCPHAPFLDRQEYRHISTCINRPVIIRGIAAGWILDNQSQHGLDTWFIETGYLGNYPGPNNLQGRKIWHRVVKNAMQLQHVLDVPDDRWRALVSWDPKLAYQGWRSKQGRRILLVTPSQKPCQYYGIDRDQWVQDTCAQLSRYTDREIVIRDKKARWNRTKNTLYDVLDDVHAVVTYNSIAAVEAIQYGIPAFALAPTAAEPVVNKDLSRIESPWRADESFVYKWLCSLAYGQFNLQELISGRAWRLLQENQQRATINV